MGILSIILLIIFTAGTNNLFFTRIANYDDGFFKYLLKTTFCLILSVTIVALTIGIFELFTYAVKIICLWHL